MIPRYAPTYTYSDIFDCLKSNENGKFEGDLEVRLSNLFGAKHVFLLNSARVGLYAILKAYNHPGRVLLPAYNCIVVPEAVHYAGYQPGFVDIRPSTLNLSPEDLEMAITPDTTAVLATHLFGIPCDIEEITRVFKGRNILVIEDAAPALGAEFAGRMVGCFGDASIISFQSTKVISGDVGGALITNNDELAENIKTVLVPKEEENHKWYQFLKLIAYKTALQPVLYALLRTGYSIFRKESMYDVVPATMTQPKNYVSYMPQYARALIEMQLDRLEWNLKRRRKIVQIYLDQLTDSKLLHLPEIPKSASPSWIQFPLICDDKLSFYRYMKSRGVDVSWTYKYSCAESFGFSGFPNTTEAAKKVVSLPTTPFITDQQAHQISHTALSFSKSYKY